MSTSSPICEVQRWCLSFWTLSLVIVMLATLFAVNTLASDSSEIVSIDPPALALARYIVSLHQRSPFTESGPVRIKIEASLPSLGKQACLSAVRETGESERSEYHALQTEGDPMVKREVIGRYLSAQAEGEELALSSTLIIPANYKFRYSGSIQVLGTLLYVFEISARKKRVGLIRGQIWIDPVTGIAVHEAGHFVKTPSILLRRIDVARDTTLHAGVPYVRITHTAIETRWHAFRAELTITEQPVRAPDEDVTSKLTREGSRP